MTDWVPIDGYPLYSVDSLGQVRNDRTNRILRPKINQFGVVNIGLMGEDGVQHHRSLALLVARTFIPQELEAFDTPINLDGNRWNCAVDNLMWRPRWFAIQYHRQFKERYYEPIPVPIRNLADNQVFPDSMAVCITFGLLEKDLVRSIEMRTYVWPTYQMFDLAD
jgi:NUMOD4 motif